MKEFQGLRPRPGPLESSGLCLSRIDQAGGACKHDGDGDEDDDAGDGGGAETVAVQVSLFLSKVHSGDVLSSVWNL